MGVVLLLWAVLQYSILHEALRYHAGTGNGANDRYLRSRKIALMIP